MKTITISVVGEASIKENKVVVDYTELKELVAERDVYKKALENLMNSIGGGKKRCGHEFTCTCPWDEAKAAMDQHEQ